MKHIRQNTADLITIRSFKEDRSGVLITQKRDCISIEFETIPEIINELIWLSDHKIEPKEPKGLTEDELKQWKRIEHMKASLHHCVVGYEKKLADKEKNYQMIMRENERFLTRIESLTNKIKSNGNT